MLTTFLSDYHDSAPAIRQLPHAKVRCSAKLQRYRVDLLLSQISPRRRSIL